MFGGKARPYPSEAPKCSTLGKTDGLTHKHYTRLEGLATDKRPSLLQKVVTYVRKIFYNIGPLG
jgi:hypothetical protein